MTEAHPVDHTSLEVSGQQHLEADTTQKQSKGSHAWLQASGAFLVYVATWGLLSAYGTYQSYYETTILVNYSTSQIAWIGTVEGVLLIFCGVVSGPIYDHGYVCELLISGAFLTVLGVMMLSLSTEYYQIMLSQGWCVGIGSGVLYVPCISLVASTFDPKWRALAVCFATSGTAVGGIIYPIVLEQLIPTVGFAWATRILGLVTLVELIVALSIIVPFSGTKQTRWWKGSATSVPSARAVTPRPLFDTTSFQEPAFVVFCIALFFMWVSYWVPFFLIPTFAQFALGASASWAFYLLVITNAATIPGRFFAVLVIPYLGVAGGMFTFSVASAILLFSWAGVKSMPGFEVWIVVLGVIMTPLAVFYPAIVPQLCPRPDLLGTRMGISSAAAALGIILGAPLSSALVDIEKAEFWKMQVFVGSSMTMGAGLMAFVWCKVRTEEPK
ncbi:putative monocarboxylate permease [Xylariales sp. PMI_506]|nr:putative monocarboxylate permease [Xylariales sp. PMI_506]